MRLLLDTHALLFWLQEPNRLGAHALLAIDHAHVLAVADLPRSHGDAGAEAASTFIRAEGRRPPAALVQNV